jgi:hypothetical protein
VLGLERSLGLGAGRVLRRSGKLHVEVRMLLSGRDHGVIIGVEGQVVRLEFDVPD